MERRSSSIFIRCEEHLSISVDHRYEIRWAIKVTAPIVVVKISDSGTSAEFRGFLGCPVACLTVDGEGKCGVIGRR